MIGFYADDDFYDEGFNDDYYDDEYDDAPYYEGDCDWHDDDDYY